MPRFGFPFQPLQVGPHVSGVLIAHLAILFQSLADNFFQLGRKIRVQADRGNRITIQNLAEDDCRTLAPEGQRARRHLVQHRAEGKQIAPRIQLLRARLLRRHISDRAERGTGTGQVLLVHGRLLNRRSARVQYSVARGRHFRQPKIQNLCVSTFGHQNIGGLDVPVDDAFRVRGIERVGNFNCQSEQYIRLHGPSRDAMLQGHAVQKLHDQKGMPVILPDLVDGADIGMVESRGRLRLSLETGQGLGVLRDRVGQKLQRHKPVQVDVLSLVDHTHAATAKLFNDAVMRDGLADHGIEKC